MKKCVIFILACILFSNCKKKNAEEILVPPGPNPVGLTSEPGEELSAGSATVISTSKDAFGFQLSNMPASMSADFSVGNSFFRLPWVIAPSSTSARDGLGPMLNANSCGTCHGLDGRGRPPIEGESEFTSMLLRISLPGEGIHGEPVDVPDYGDQLNDKAIPGVIPEGKPFITYTEIPGKYSDGTSYSLRNPTYTILDFAYGNPGNILISPRVAPQLPGLGLLEAVEESLILSSADPYDVNADGISGRANYVWNATLLTKTLGRFGWKANQPNLLQQTSGAFNGDMGITSSIFQYENLKGKSKALFDTIPSGGKPEIQDSILKKIVFYCQTLSVPARRNWKEQNVLSGKTLFNELGCHLCHTPKMVTGKDAVFPEMANQTIRPFTDLLLHDMGEGLADGRTDFLASKSEWRTPPLWGIGLIKTVNNHTFFLHDGRARNLEEAILWHGGEAEQAKMKYTRLNKLDRDNLIKFLESL
ncbi:MAG: c-type cytochrome [Opitutaceae bacterium]|nr:c-type cytochrome [Cytophagales bacterium]